MDSVLAIILSPIQMLPAFTKISEKKKEYEFRPEKYGENTEIESLLKFHIVVVVFICSLQLYFPSIFRSKPKKKLNNS